ncbi:TRAP transporter large permease subunit [Sagittula sp. NFXS13]
MNAIIGRMRSGMAQVAIVSRAGLASVSGAVADASALSLALWLRKQYGLGLPVV